MIGWHLHVRFAASDAAVVTDFWLLETAFDTSRLTCHAPLPLPQKTVRVPSTHSHMANGHVANGTGAPNGTPDAACDAVAAATIELSGVRESALTLGTVASFRHQLAAAGLRAELTSDHTLHLAPLPAAACCPPLPKEQLAPHSVGLAPLLRSTLGGGWQVACPSHFFLSVLRALGVSPAHGMLPTHASPHAPFLTVPPTDTATAACYLHRASLETSYCTGVRPPTASTALRRL